MCPMDTFSLCWPSVSVCSFYLGTVSFFSRYNMLSYLATQFKLDLWALWMLLFLLELHGTVSDCPCLICLRSVCNVAMADIIKAKHVCTKENRFIAGKYASSITIYTEGILHFTKKKYMTSNINKNQILTGKSLTKLHSLYQGNSLTSKRWKKFCEFNYLWDLCNLNLMAVFILNYLSSIFNNFSRCESV